MSTENRENTENQKIEEFENSEIIQNEEYSAPVNLNNSEKILRQLGIDESAISKLRNSSEEDVTNYVTEIIRKRESIFSESKGKSYFEDGRKNAIEEIKRKVKRSGIDDDIVSKVENASDLIDLIVDVQTKRLQEDLVNERKLKSEDYARQLDDYEKKMKNQQYLIEELEREREESKKSHENELKNLKFRYDIRESVFRNSPSIDVDFASRGIESDIISAYNIDDNKYLVDKKSNSFVYENSEKITLEQKVKSQLEKYGALRKNHSENPVQSAYAQKSSTVINKKSAKALGIEKAIENAKRK